MSDRIAGPDTYRQLIAFTLYQAIVVDQILKSLKFMYVRLAARHMSIAVNSTLHTSFLTRKKCVAEGTTFPVSNFSQFCNDFIASLGNIFMII